MSEEHLGASASQTGLSQQAAEPEVSALRASIPSVEAFHPSEYIQDELDARGWDKIDLAVRMGGDSSRNLLALDIYFIVGPQRSNCRLGDAMAHQLAIALDVSAQFFLNLEQFWLAHAQAIKASPVLLSQERQAAELALLYNHSDDDSRQFTRWQMMTAIAHGHRIAAQGIEAGTGETEGLDAKRESAVPQACAPTGSEA